MTWDVELDTLGLLCPLPILKARKRLMSMKSGEVLRMLADDPAAMIDVPHFCFETNYELLSQEIKGNQLLFFIQK